MSIKELAYKLNLIWYKQRVDLEISSSYIHVELLIDYHMFIKK